MVDAVVALDALSEMRAGIQRYARDTEAGIDAIGSVLRDVRHQVEQEVRKRAQERDAAENSLCACQARPFANCSGEAQRFQVARARLERAQAARSQVDAAATRFAPARLRFTSSLSSVVPEALEFLGQRQRAIEEYAQRVGGALGSDTPGISLLSAGGASAGPGNAASPGVSTPDGLPPGYGLVSLDLIDDTDSTVTGPESFGKGYSPEDLRWAFDALDDVVMPALARGLGADYLQDRDQREGRQGIRSYMDTLSGFLTDDGAITLESNADGRYVVSNGYHRVWVARRAGRQHVPARIR
jgi:hypothetical protein